MNPLARYAIVFGVAVVSIVGSYFAGVRSGAIKEELEWRKKQVDLNDEISGLRIKIRAQEDEHQEKIRSIEYQYIKDDEQRNEDQDMLISALRDGNIKLREQFKKVTVCERVSKSPTPSGTDNAAGEKGLSNSDAEFLIRFAARCDKVAGKLSAAQSYIETIK